MFIEQSTQRVSTRRLHRPQFGMRKIHEKADRLYKAARATGALDGATEQSSLARLLNVAPQNVNNWESRGVSKDAAIEAQRLLGISATWVLFGMGPMLIGGDNSAADLSTKDSPENPAWPFESISPEQYFAASPSLRAAMEESIERKLAAFTDDDGHPKRAPKVPSSGVG